MGMLLERVIAGLGYHKVHRFVDLLLLGAFTVMSESPIGNLLPDHLFNTVWPTPAVIQKGSRQTKRQPFVNLALTSGAASVELIAEPLGGMGAPT
jgi:hypothetical protein